MTNGRGIKSVGAAAIIVGFIVGAVVAARSITANRYLSIDLTHLAGLEIARQLTSWIGLALLLATVFLTVWLVARRLGRERSGLAIVTLLAISGSGLAAVDAALRRFTTLTVEFALSRAVARLGSASAPATFGEGAQAVAMTYLLALAAVGTVLVFAVWTYRRLVRTDLTRLYYRRWISHKWLHRATAVAVLLTSLTHITTAIRGDRLSPTGPNIIFVVVDALRADAMGHLGYGRDTTPFLDSLATQSIVFRNTRSQSSWTKTSVASYMTSTFGMLDACHHSY